MGEEMLYTFWIFNWKWLNLHPLLWTWTNLSLPLLLPPPLFLPFSFSLPLSTFLCFHRRNVIYQIQSRPKWGSKASSQNQSCLYQTKNKMVWNKNLVCKVLNPYSVCKVLNQHSVCKVLSYQIVWTNLETEMQSLIRIYPKLTLTGKARRVGIWSQNRRENTGVLLLFKR